MRFTLNGVRKPSLTPSFSEYTYTGSPKYLYVSTLSLRLGVAVSPSCTAGEKYSMMPRQLLSSFAPPRWHSSIMMKSKKSGGYSPKYGVPFGPLMKVWKMVKKMLPFVGTAPFLRISKGLMRTSASSGNFENVLKD